MLLEALVAILIFSLGVLSIIQLQAVSIKQASSAEYRSTAALLANDLISRMWASDKTATTLQTTFASPSGTGYTQWLSSVQNSGLPNVTAKLQFANGVTANVSQATITITWKAPGDTDSHNYTAVAQFR